MLLEELPSNYLVTRVYLVSLSPSLTPFPVGYEILTSLRSSSLMP